MSFAPGGGIEPPLILSVTICLATSCSSTGQKSGWPRYRPFEGHAHHIIMNYTICLCQPSQAERSPSQAT